ncbi:ABC transporter permease [Petroclostridium sp. X23]|uniref:ABC transporter permease n=1 Tax=Petroclostridium sp. X23 TaxID=3045146 RepID=UPI0024ADA2BD|nr:ABC transporter permease [Petroclostridium sp. X23]WHH60740.1 ABC transporter permease [Petroclostridium sp. X23]
MITIKRIQSLKYIVLNLWKSLLKYPIIIAFIIMTAVIISLSTLIDGFLSDNNLLSLLNLISFLGIAALGQSIVLVSGGIDLSVNSIYTFAGVVCAVAIQLLGLPVPIAVALGLIASVFFGLINGIIISRLKLSPFITTIGMLGIIRGCTNAITMNFPILYLPIEFRSLSQGYIGIFPFSLAVLLFFIIIISVLMHSTIIGKWIFAIGGNEWTVKISGINTDNVKMLVYVLSGSIAGIAGMLDASRIGFASPAAESGFELGTVAAAAVGSIGISSGLVSVMGTMIGTTFIGALRNSLSLLNIASCWQQIIIGIVTIYTIALANKRKADNNLFQ